MTALLTELLFDEPPNPAIRPDGQRACTICGAPAYFGFGVNVREGREGLWSCREHRAAVEACLKGNRNDHQV
jgi:hypothetical protein